MGKKGAETRFRLVAAARSLIESRGYYGTGLNQVLEVGGAPRGSLYFHFPGGKDQLVAAAVEEAGVEIGAVIQGAEGGDAREYLERLVELLGDRLEGSGWTAGCPVAGVALDAASSNDAVQRVCSGVYREWEALLRGRLAGYGHPEPERVATAVLALVEGGMILSRTYRDRGPLRRVSDTMATLV
ncbi:TetR/AcrR family transcriptional regulator [Nocardia sp. NPDC048505]|uniref:TetR/AcrR family transcriptional regulator n=1 Tax=unclassified Nocardia TaxID=2637762 RepID=UPI0033E37266